MIAALDVYATTSSDRGSTWTTPVRVTSVGSSAFDAWTDWRESTGSVEGADLKKCRTFISGACTGDQCPHEDGIDQDIYRCVTA